VDFSDVQASLAAGGFSLTPSNMYFYKLPGNPNNTQYGILPTDPIIYNNQASGTPSVNISYLAALAASTTPPASSNFTNWGWVDNSFGTNSITGTSQSYAQYEVPSFSSGGGGGSPVTPLGVEGLQLVGRTESGVNILGWQTLRETNNSHFEVQRSKDNVNFTALDNVATLAPGGNSNNPLAYQYVDRSPSAKTLFYRLKQVDLDGTATLSNTVELTVSEDFSQGIQLYPNPATNLLNVEWSIPSQKSINIEIVDMIGQVIMKESYKAKGGFEVYPMNISTLATGVYTVRVRSVDDSFNSSTQFVKTQD
jgi:hypothetical protein